MAPPRRGGGSVLARLALVLLTLSAVLHSADSASVSHRKLLQGTGEPPFILSPLVPINWFIFRDAPTTEFNLGDPVVNWWVSFSSAFLHLNAAEITLFGDLPHLFSLAIPQVTLFGGNGWNALDEEGLRAGASLIELAGWFEFEFFNLAAGMPVATVSLFDRLGLEDLGLGVPSNYVNLFDIPWAGEGVVETSIIDDSFVNFIRSRGLADLLSYPGFYGTSFSSA
ncbi:hypothetical protein HOP50_02g13120 [Chloropicon primus]|uniref:Uncharacterized protein n=2 Tax=Chloropicon primus TaxID=1764295 RepID=A0A5B8MDW8_9CHLO|nr:hypothetical protein A3770_02p13260 [Chloropicon primus]UPQ98015.1 hypothetical protein HOP50_02g13120 [Chloropicon primus]|eukprot:QDZ18808.1 hypothetical protein A3770_02p13260 [Chloropicon primus]